MASSLKKGAAVMTVQTAADVVAFLANQPGRDNDVPCLNCVVSLTLESAKPECRINNGPEGGCWECRVSGEECLQLPRFVREDGVHLITLSRLILNMPEEIDEVRQRLRAALHLGEKIEVDEEEEIAQVPDAQDAEQVEDNLHKSGAHTEALEALIITTVAEKGAGGDEKANKEKKEVEELKEELVVLKKEAQYLTENAELKKVVLDLQKMACEKLEKEVVELKKEVQYLTENAELKKVVHDLKKTASEKKKEVITESKLETELKKINQEMDKVAKALENIKVRDGAPRPASPVIPPKSWLDFGNNVWKPAKFPASDPAEEDSDEIGANTPTPGSSAFDDAGSGSMDFRDE